MITIEKFINGVKYTAVWLGLKENSRLIGNCTNDGILEKRKLINIIFDKIIINPKKNINDFDNIIDFDNVYNFGLEVISGEFDKISRSKAKKEVENEWGAWRLVLSQRGFTYNEVFNNMTPSEILKANIALDIILKAEKKASKKK